MDLFLSTIIVSTFYLRMQQLKLTSRIVTKCKAGFCLLSRCLHMIQIFLWQKRWWAITARQPFIWVKYYSESSNIQDCIAICYHQYLHSQHSHCFSGNERAFNGTWITQSSVPMTPTVPSSHPPMESSFMKYFTLKVDTVGGNKVIVPSYGSPSEVHPAICEYGRYIYISSLSDAIID